VTRGADGMTLFEAGVGPVHIPVASNSEGFDVTGAGDMVVVAFTLVCLAGVGYPEAAQHANVAGDLSVRRSGTKRSPDAARRAGRVG
jgi:bifunctional ADP-heptose synthase (sugar kinase/adenylyltransferase)